MSTNISLFGLSLRIVADRTFPQGFTVTEFADDVDPFESPALALAEYGMGINADLVTWQKANVMEVTLGIIPNSSADRNLTILMEANRPAKNKGAGTLDNVTFTASYPDGRIVTLSEGFIVEGMPILAGQTSGRMKSRTFKFVFENRDDVIPNI